MIILIIYNVECNREQPPSVVLPQGTSSCKQSKHQSQTIQVPRDTLYSKKVQVITDLKGKQTESGKTRLTQIKNQPSNFRIKSYLSASAK